MSDRKYSAIIAGEKFGRLTTVSIFGTAKDGHREWVCECECGELIVRKTNSLRASSSSSSCGCTMNIHAKKHGMRNSPEYSSWMSAKYRCHNKKSKDYPSYGGAGIFMCEKWRNSFESFYAELGNRPEGTTLDRIDGNKGYEPGNCRWADISVQASNRKAGLVTTVINGKVITAKQFAELVGISHAAALNRIRRGRIYV